MSGYATRLEHVGWQAQYATRLERQVQNCATVGYSNILVMPIAQSPMCTFVRCRVSSKLYKYNLHKLFHHYGKKIPNYPMLKLQYLNEAKSILNAFDDSEITARLQPTNFFTGFYWQRFLKTILSHCWLSRTWTLFLTLWALFEQFGQWVFVFFRWWPKCDAPGSLQIWDPTLGLINDLRVPCWRGAEWFRAHVDTDNVVVKTEIIQTWCNEVSRCVTDPRTPM